MVLLHKCQNELAKEEKLLLAYSLAGKMEHNNTDRIENLKACMILHAVLTQFIA
jgi:hypothetical protein